MGMQEGSPRLSLFLHLAFAFLLFLLLLQCKGWLPPEEKTVTMHPSNPQWPGNQFGVSPVSLI